MDPVHLVAEYLLNLIYKCIYYLELHYLRITCTGLFSVVYYINDNNFARLYNHV